MKVIKSIIVMSLIFVLSAGMSAAQDKVSVTVACGAVGIEKEFVVIILILVSLQKKLIIDVVAVRRFITQFILPGKTHIGIHRNSLGLIDQTFGLLFGEHIVFTLGLDSPVCRIIE